jgi:large subunit ribosomal protein L17
MRHRKFGVKLNRTTSHRQAMFRNMVTSLLKHDRIRTTDAKAKELRRWADHMVSLAKQGDLHARRQALTIVREKDVVHRLFEKVQENFGDRSGGYTRIIKIGRRPGDAAPLVLVEMVTREPSTPKRTPKKKVKPAPAPQTPVVEKPAAESAPVSDEAAATQGLPPAADQEGADAASEVSGAAVDAATDAQTEADSAAAPDQPPSEITTDEAPADKEK